MLLLGKLRCICASGLSPSKNWRTRSLCSNFGSNSSRKSFPEAGPPITIELTEWERAIFSLFVDMVKEEKLGTTVRVAGGWVRDKLLKIDGKPDIDFCLDNISGRQFTEALCVWSAKTSRMDPFLKETQVIVDSKTGLKKPKAYVILANASQSKHLETASMRVGEYSLDFVNLRKDMYSSSSRIPTIRIGTPSEDAHRRDLTINSLFYNLHTGAVEDYTKRGIDDLKKGAICTPLSPLVTLRDDPLRALRAVRFTCRFGFQMDKAIVIAASNPSISEKFDAKISRARVFQEMLPTLGDNDPYKALRGAVMLKQMKLLPLVLKLPHPIKENIARINYQKSPQSGESNANEATSAHEELRSFHARAVSIFMLQTAITNSPQNQNPSSKFTSEFQQISTMIRKGDLSENTIEKNMSVTCAALTFPAIGMECNKPQGLKGAFRISLPDYILNHNLMIGKTMYRSCNSIQEAAVLFGSVLEELISYNESASKLKPVVASNNGHTTLEYKCIQRERLGMIMRDHGSCFLPGLTLALSNGLLQRLIKAQELPMLNSKNKRLDTQLINDGIIDMIGATLYGSTNSWESSYEPANAFGFYDNLLSGPHIDISFGDDLMNAGRDVISAIHTMRLVVDYDSKPLLNGHQVMQILKNVPKNDFKVINEEIVRWQLSQPPEMRTEEAITAHLLDKYSAYR